MKRVVKQTHLEIIITKIYPTNEREYTGGRHYCFGPNRNSGNGTVEMVNHNHKRAA